MPAFNFHPRFEEAVRTGAKLQTLRRPRKDSRRPAKLGDTINLWVGQRTQYRRQIGTGWCVEVSIVTLSRQVAVVAGVSLSPAERPAFAKADGFETYGELIDYLERINPPGEPGEDFEFWGYLIRWELVT